MITDRLRLITIVAWCGLCLLGCDPTWAQEPEESATMTNLDVMRLLARQAGEKVGTEFHSGDSIALSVVPKESAWWIEGALNDGLRSRGLFVTGSDRAPFVAQFGFTNARTEYDNPRRSGLFGPRLVDRKVSVWLDVKASENGSGKILASSTIASSRMDTIRVSEIQSLENPNLPVTRGVLPPEGFFSNLAEPLIVIGATAIAVFLLFTVRS